jgi:hypothetical protein
VSHDTSQIWLTGDNDSLTSFAVSMSGCFPRAVVCNLVSLPCCVCWQGGYAWSVVRHDSPLTNIDKHSGNSAWCASSACVQQVRYILSPVAAVDLNMLMTSSSGALLRTIWMIDWLFATAELGGKIRESFVFLHVIFDPFPSLIFCLFKTVMAQPFRLWNPHCYRSLCYFLYCAWRSGR